MVKIRKAKAEEIKKEVWRLLVLDTEKRIGKKLPKEIRDLVFKTIERKLLEYRFQRKNKIIKSLLSDINELESWFNNFSREEEKLGTSCREFASRIVMDVYQSGNESVIEKTWKYIAEIWDLTKSIEIFLSKSIFTKKKFFSKYEARQFLMIYGQLYTILVEKILAE